MFSKMKIMKSTMNCSGQIERLLEEIKTTDAILIGAGSGLSTSVGLTYNGERFDIVNIAQPPRGERRYTIVNFENMRIDPLTRYVFYNGREIVLTKQEFDLLHLLARHAGQVLTHEQIRCHVWGDDFMGNEGNAISVGISRLRQKLGDAPIETVRGVGYRFKKDSRQQK